MSEKLELTVDSYEQRLSDDRDGPTREYSRGELIEPRDEAEAHRLTEIGAASEPGSAQREEAERLQAEAKRLQAEAEAAEQRADAAEETAEKAASGEDDLSGLTKDELVGVAEAEQVEVDPDARKAEVLDAIRAARAAG